MALIVVIAALGIAWPPIIAIALIVAGLLMWVAVGVSIWKGVRARRADYKRRMAK